MLRPTVVKVTPAEHYILLAAEIRERLARNDPERYGGELSNAYSNAAGGKQMIVEHVNGYKTGYAHLSEFRKQTGDRMAAGTVIALSGNTGNTTGPHLHFTLTGKDGVKMDPEKKFHF